MRQTTSYPDVHPLERQPGTATPRNDPAMMEIRNCTKHYPQGRRMVRALNGVNLRIDTGEFVSIMGPSGSGKSTLMHLLGALDVPSSGDVFFQDRSLGAMSDAELAQLRRTRIGFIF